MPPPGSVVPIGGDVVVEMPSVVGAEVVGGAVFVSSVVGAAVVGEAVVGGAVAVNRVVGAAVVGASVVGAAVLVNSVVGGEVVVSFVVGGPLVGGIVVDTIVVAMVVGGVVVVPVVGDAVDGDAVSFCSHTPVILSVTLSVITESTSFVETDEDIRNARDWKMPPFGNDMSTDETAPVIGSVIVSS